MVQSLFRSSLSRPSAWLAAAALWFCCGLAVAADLRQPVLKVTVKGGHFGVTDARGNTRVPFIYDAVEQAGRGFFIVGIRDPENPGSEKRYGVVDDRGRVIVPPTWAGIEHNTRHGRFEVAAPNDNLSQGILDEQGKVIVPAIYDRLQRISNMGDEPTVIALRGGKFGYVDIVTGKVLIPVEYDVLRIDSLDVDAEGVGLAVAALKGRWGVLATDGSVVVPFDYDVIAELDRHAGSAMAERGGRLMRLDLRNGRFAGDTEVPILYSSNFVPRPEAAAQAPAGDGLYAAEEFPTMRAAWDAHQRGKLHWVAIPSVQLQGQRMHVAFGQFRNLDLPALPNVMAVRRDGSRLLLVDDDTPAAERNPFLTFTLADGALVCHECPGLGLPTRWRQVPPPEPPKPFGGIGLVFSKDSTALPLRVTRLVPGGPAQQSGLAEGDLIVRVNDTDVSGFTADQAREALRGAAGTRVTLHVLRDGKALPDPIGVERKVIDLRR